MVAIVMGLSAASGFPISQAYSGRDDGPTYSLQQTLDDDGYVMGLEASRVHIMVNQIATILGRTEEVVEVPGPSTAGALLVDLQLTVARFNRLLPEACKLSKAILMDCGAYHPSWDVSGMTSPSIALEEVYAHVMPVWKAVCSSSKPHCVME